MQVVVVVLVALVRAQVEQVVAEMVSRVLHLSHLLPGQPILGAAEVAV
jgi:hypothetical protein